MATIAQVGSPPRARRHAVPLFSRILAGADGTPRADEAVRQAARIAHLTGAELEVAFVSDSIGLGGSPERRLAVADRVLNDASATARRRHVEPTTRLLVGAAEAKASAATTVELVGPEGVRMLGRSRGKSP